MKGVAYHGDPCLDKGAQGVEPLWLPILAFACSFAPSQDCIFQCFHPHELILRPAESA